MSLSANVDHSHRLSRLWVSYFQRVLHPLLTPIGVKPSPAWSAAILAHVELMPWCLMSLCCFLHTRKGNAGDFSFIDSTPFKVCNPCRAHSHKVFKGLVHWGKNSVSWHLGFKLHLIINDQGELLAFKLTPANIYDRQPVSEMAQDWCGKLFGVCSAFRRRIVDIFPKNCSSSYMNKDSS